MNLKEHKNSNFLFRILHFPLVQIIIGILLVNVTTFMMRSVAQLILSSLSMGNHSMAAFILFCVRSLTVYFAYVLFVRIFEKRNAEEITLNALALKETSMGGLLGLCMMTFVIGLMWLLKIFTVSAIDGSAPLFRSFLHHSFFAFLQDIVYFAIIFRIVEKNLGSWTAIVLASIIFGFKHLLFPGYTLWSVIAQMLEAGILFSALFMISRRIWLIFGFHVVWNTIQYGLLLGFDAEGLTPLFHAEFSGSNLMTGMPVGLEASLITFCIGTATGIFFLIKAHQTGKFIKPYWKRG